MSDQDTKSQEDQTLQNGEADKALEASQGGEAGAGATAEVKPAAKKRKVESKQNAPTDKLYMTKQEHSIPFDIQVKGVILNGQWSMTDKHVEFIVPADLVEGFEQHYHFQAGNVVAAE